MEKITILAVDDDEAILDLYRLHAEDQGFNTIVTDSANQALDILKDTQVDLIISDIYMPELDGYEFCRLVKANPETKDIPFIFVSGMTKLEELTVGYDLGADDYICKPIIYEQLSVKIQQIVNLSKKNTEIQGQLNNYYKTAMEAMSYSSELGQILEFYKACDSTTSYKEIANYLFMTTNTLGLKCCFQVYGLNGEINGFSSQGSIQPLETEIMELAKKQTRFYDFGQRTVISYKTFSLLIKNMPLEDAEKYGRYKDILGTLCDAISARVDILLTHSVHAQKQQVVETVSATMVDIDTSYNLLQKENVTAIEDMLENIEEALATLGLTEYQEENIHKIVEKCLQDTNAAFYKGVTINSNLVKLREQLSSILD